MKKNIYNLNNPSLNTVKESLLDTFKHKHIVTIDINDPEADFFTKKLPLSLSNFERAELNERVWIELTEKGDIYTGFNFSSDENFRDSNLDPVYIPVMITERDSDQDMIPQTIVKVDMYTGDMSFILAEATYDLYDIDNVDYLNDNNECISDLLDDFLVAHKRSTRDDFNDFLIEYADDKLRDDHRFIRTGKLEYVDSEISNVTEWQLDEELKRALAENLSRNNKEFSKCHNENLLVGHLKKEAVKAITTDKYKVREAQRRNIDVKNIVANLEVRPEEENELSIKRDGNKFILTGTFKGSYTELCAEISRINKAAKRDYEKPELLVEHANGTIKSVVMFYKRDGGYYEIGTELPKEFANTDNLDEEKICNLLGLKGVPVTVENVSPAVFGSIEGKPAIFVMLKDVSRDMAIDIASDNTEAVAKFSFVEHFSKHSVDELVKDEFIPLIDEDIDSDMDLAAGI